MEDNQTSLLEKILVSMTDLTGKVDNIAERVGTLETKTAAQAAAIPQFVPMHEEEAPTYKTAISQLEGVGDEVSGGRQAVVGTDGLPRPRQLRRLVEGTKVRLAPNSPTASTIRNWREAGHRAPDPDKIIGTVVGFHFVSTNGEAKYRVRFPGLTTARGDGFYASELVPA